MADDPFIEIRWVDHTARWFCTSCGQADDTPYVTEESARIAGEDHSAEIRSPTPCSVWLTNCQGGGVHHGL